MKNLITRLCLLIITAICLNTTNVYAACEGATHGSNECKVTSRGEIYVYGDTNGKYRDFYTTTTNSRTSITTTNNYATLKNGTKVPVNYYSNIGVSNDFGGVWYHAYQDSYSALYCLDAQYDGGDTLYGWRFLMDSNKSINIKAQDYALLSVMTNGGQGYLTTVNNGNISDYWARLLAIRAILATFGNFNEANLEYQGAFYAMYGSLNSWLNADSSAYNELVSALTEAGYGSTVKSRDFFKDRAYYTFRGTQVSRAQQYYNTALSEAAEFVRKYNEGATVDTNTTPEATQITETTDSRGTLVQRDVTHIIKVSGLPRNGTNSFTIDGITIDNVPEGLTYYIKSIQVGDDVDNIIETSNNGEDIKQILGANLLGGAIDWDFTEETEIKIVVHFEGYKSSNSAYVDILKCGDAEIEYSIDGTYASEVENKYSGYVATIWNSGISKTQRYVGIETVSNPNSSTLSTPWSSSNKTSLIEPCDCDDLITACKESNSITSDACQELLAADCGECAELDVECDLGNEESCEKYGALCEVECLTTVDNFDCCDAQNNLLIISPNDDHKVSILGPQDSDIYSCFVSQVNGQIDLAGEDVGADEIVPEVGAKDDVGNSYTIDTNRYCVVSCKEDYNMTLPTAKLVNAGRYFTFKASVDGTKTCYTNTIDRELYHKDIIDAQKKLASAYNEYKKWYELYHNGTITPVPGSYPSSCTCNSHGCGPSCSNSTYYPNWRATATVPDWQTVTAENENTGQISVSVGSNGVSAGYVYEELTGSSTYSCPGGSWTTTSCSGTGENRVCTDHDHSCSGGTATYYTGTRVVNTEADFREYLRGQMVTAQGKLESAEKDFEDVIKAYNECSEWETEFKYDEDNPHVYYDYEESYMAELENNQGTMEMVISNSSESDWYCNSNVSNNGSENEATVNGSYDSCSSGSTGQRYTGVYYNYCDVNGCRREDRDVSDARYKKVTSTISANYIPATLFYNIYPSGEIVTANEYGNRDDGVALENSLPVSLSTKRGIYIYTVNISSLGEFYEGGSVFGRASTGNSGRLVATNALSASMSVLNNREDFDVYINDNGELQYLCNYLVNMGETIETGDVVCDWKNGCDDGDCIANCIGPNCHEACDGEDCIADCIGAGCIYDSDAGTSLIERVVSLSNLFPNGTDSYNWNREANEKAEVTIDEIQGAGNEIYNEEPILSVTITPSVARAIKLYNDDVEDYGGYSNSTLECYAIGDYEEIACYSSFIQGLLDGHIEYDGVNYINNIDVVNDRSLIMGNNYRSVRNDNTTYFTTWSGEISEDKMLGPSWK